MKTAIITMSALGAKIGRKLATAMPGSRLFFHRSVRGASSAGRFDHVLELAKRVFHECRNIIFIAPCGVAVRAVAPLIRNKKTDPAVVVIDVGCRHAVSLLSGHEGGANDLAFSAANILGAEPVITTTTDAMRNVIVGIGCRRGAGTGAIINAVNKALDLADISMDDVRCLATAEIKRREKGLIEAARRLNRPLRIIPNDEIRKCRREFGVSEFVRSKTGLPAVAEPAALLAGRRTTLVLGKRAFAGTTVALAKENFIS